MLKRIKKWFFHQWQKFPEKKRDNIELNISTLMSFIAALFAFSTIIHFDDPDQAPYAGAFITVFSYFAFTRLKSTQDGYARDFETKLVDLNSQNYHYESSAIKRDIIIESYNRELADFKTNQRIDEILENKKSLPPTMFMTSSSLVSRNRKSPPRAPDIINAAVMKIGNYQQLTKEYRRSIKRHRAYSNRLAALEALGIIYGAAITIFGAEFIRMWNS